MTAAVLPPPMTMQERAEKALANPAGFNLSEQDAIPLLHEVLRAAAVREGRSPEERRARYEAAAVLLERVMDMGPMYLLSSLPLVAALAHLRENGWPLPVAAYKKIMPTLVAAGVLRGD